MQFLWAFFTITPSAGSFLRYHPARIRAAVDILDIPSRPLERGNSTLSHGCKSCGTVEVLVRPTSFVLPYTNECLCTIKDDFNDGCECNTLCEEKEAEDFCTDLLGPCTCSRDNNTGKCGCRGFCGTSLQRADACNHAFGCTWISFYCGSGEGVPALYKTTKWIDFAKGFDQEELGELRRIRKILRQGMKEETETEAISKIIEHIKVVKVPTLG